MPRKSAAELSMQALSVITGEPRRLDPPSHLDESERALFAELVAACSPKHFVASDLPLLVSFVQATLLSRQAATRAATDATALAAWEKATRMQATLATRLRLAPQARTHPKSTARQLPKTLRPPWEDDPLDAKIPPHLR